MSRNDGEAPGVPERPQMPREAGPPEASWAPRAAEPPRVPQVAEVPQGPRELWRPQEPGAPLPDLLALGLAELRTIDHPVLREVLADLRERAAQPSETLWGFNNAF